MDTSHKTSPAGFAERRPHRSRITNPTANGLVRTFLWCSLSLFALACATRSTGSPASSPQATESPTSAQLDAPTITTLIFEETQGVDTLSLKHVIRTPGYLKKTLPKRMLLRPDDRFLFTLYSVAGDTVAQWAAPSTLQETIETGDENGEITAVPVQHEISAHTLRHTGTRIHHATVTIFGAAGAVLTQQDFDLAPDAPQKD